MALIAIVVVGFLLGWVVAPELRFWYRVQHERVLRWWRGQCRWCPEHRVPRRSILLASGNIHAFVARKKGLCYDCAKAWVHERNYEGGQELLARLHRATRRFRAAEDLDEGDLVIIDSDGGVRRVRK